MKTFLHTMAQRLFAPLLYASRASARFWASAITARALRAGGGFKGPTKGEEGGESWNELPRGTTLPPYPAGAAVTDLPVSLMPSCDVNVEETAADMFSSTASKGFCTLQRAKQGLHTRTKFWYPRSGREARLGEHFEQMMIPHMRQ